MCAFMQHLQNFVDTLDVSVAISDQGVLLIEILRFVHYINLYICIDNHTFRERDVEKD